IRCFSFFFQAEDGIRDRNVTGVQTCALPIYYKSFSWLTKKPAAVIIVYLSPGANAVDTANRVITFLDDAKKNFPAGIEYKVGYDATRFVRAAITEVVETLFIAVALVIIVVFL